MVYIETTLFKRRLALAALFVCAGVARGDATIEIDRRLPNAQALYDPVALSPTARWLATVERAREGHPILNVYEVSTGKRVARFRSVVTMLAAWHPSKPLIAAPCDLGWSGQVLRLLDVRTGKVQWFNPEDGKNAEPVAWLPDGLRVLTARGTYYGRKPGDEGEIPGLWGPHVVDAVAVASDWTVAAEPRGNQWEPSAIEIYRKQPGRLAYTLAAKLLPDRDPATGKVTSFRNQPGFLASGRLAYARVFLDKTGKRQRVELWTCRSDGSDERKWLSLPLIPKETRYPPGRARDPGVYRLAPVSWTRDGKMIAYVYQGAVHVKRVKPPAAH